VEILASKFETIESKADLPPRGVDDQSFGYNASSFRIQIIRTPNRVRKKLECN
jgi:hypothetical protein